MSQKRDEILNRREPRSVCVAHVRLARRGGRAFGSRLTDASKGKGEAATIVSLTCVILRVTVKNDSVDTPQGVETLS